MRRMTWIAAIILSFALVLSACGTKDVESVVKDLDKFLNSMDGYSGTGTMTLHNGQQPHTYQVEVAYQKPDAYRIQLTNVEKDITQIVLRNEDGVFVLTPKQKKIFRFQSDWPQKQGQVYLYQTLVQSILLDGSRVFATTDDAYVFDVMAKYNSSSLARQKIWLSKDDYRPLQVEVSDTNANVLVDVKFDTFQFNPRFDDSYFSTDANMNADTSSSSAENQPTGALEPDTNATGDSGVGSLEDVVQNESGSSNEENNSDAQEQERNTEETPTGMSSNQSFVAMEASYVPHGVTLKDMLDIEYAGNPGLMTRYEGLYNYTLLQAEAKDIATSLVPGNFVSLGYTIGELTIGENVQTLSWTYNGNLYRLTSSDLPEAEMIKIAQSVQAEVSK